MLLHTNVDPGPEGCHSGQLKFILPVVGVGARIEIGLKVTSNNRLRLVVAPSVLKLRMNLQRTVTTT